jgi:hypothetical protein
MFVRVARTALFAVIFSTSVAMASSVAAVTFPLPPTDGPIPGSRVVTTRNNNGGLASFTAIPSGSKFLSHGGAGSPCEFDGEPQPDGNPIKVQSMNWIFIEGNAWYQIPIPVYPASTSATTWKEPIPTLGPLSAHIRYFDVYCQSADAVNFKQNIAVPTTDPALDVRRRIDILRNGIQLERPTIVDDFTVAMFGQLVTRHPSWMAINPNSWGNRESNTEQWRGSDVKLILKPTNLSFAITQRPPAGTTPGIDPGVHEPFTLTIACYDTTRAKPDPDATRFPARPPTLAAISQPGVGTEIGLGPCVWTPGYLGTATITARITYTVTLWASGYTEQLLEPYEWESAPTDYIVGGLSNVNVNSTE